MEWKEPCILFRTPGPSLSLTSLLTCLSPYTLVSSNEMYSQVPTQLQIFFELGKKSF